MPRRKLHTHQILISESITTICSVKDASLRFFSRKLTFRRPDGSDAERYGDDEAHEVRKGHQIEWVFGGDKKSHLLIAFNQGRSPFKDSLYLARSGKSLKVKITGEPGEYKYAAVLLKEEADGVVPIATDPIIIVRRQNA